MKQRFKKWWFSILMWLLMSGVYATMFWWLNADKDDLTIIGGCCCGFIILGFMLMIIGIANMPEKEDTKYKKCKDFLEWYEKQKEKEK